MDGGVDRRVRRQERGVRRRLPARLRGLLGAAPLRAHAAAPVLLLVSHMTRYTHTHTHCAACSGLHHSAVLLLVCHTLNARGRRGRWPAPACINSQLLLSDV